MTTTTHRQTRSSRLRHRFTLQQEVETADGAGGFERSWQTIADLWGEFVQLRGVQVVMGEQLQSEFNHRILLRYRDGVVPGMRLLFDSRIFFIRAIINVDERNNTLELTVVEGTI